jgi:hypothetical protein
MTGLDPVIQENVAAREDLDGRIKSGHDEEGADIFAGDGDRPPDLQAEMQGMSTRGPPGDSVGRITMRKSYETKQEHR